MSETSSYRRIVKSTSVIGAATIGTIALGLLRVKIFALLVGPAGIGIYGILNTALAWASAVLGLGVSSSSVREIAATLNHKRERDAIRSSTWILTALLATTCLCSVWLLRLPIASALNLGQDGPTLIGWVAIAAAVTIVGGTQLGELQAFGRIGDMAKVRLFGALGGTVVAVGLTVQFGIIGLAAGLAGMGAVNLLVGLSYQLQLPRLDLRLPRSAVLLRSWRELILLGFMLMVSGFAGYLGQIALRALIARHDGMMAAGFYQAAWGLSVANLGIILGAVVTDYYPRLAQVDDSSEAGERLVNQQLRILILVGGPLLLGVSALAPVAMQVLYSRAFVAGTELLRWHLLGDIFKLPGWCFGYVLVVRKNGRAFILAECGMALLNVVMYVLMRDELGVNAAGVAYLVAVSTYSILVMSFCRRRYTIALDRSNLRLLGFWAATLALMFCIAAVTNAMLAAVIGVPVAIIAGTLNMRRLHQLLGRPSLRPRNLMAALRRM